jgi:hypothetical protein
MTDLSSREKVHELIEAYCARARAELDDRVEKWRLTFEAIDSHAVIGGLLARQVTLAVQIASCPRIWNAHVAPLLLRAMADLHITIDWVLQDPPDRSRKFIHYGLGQLKLELEHRRAELRTREPGAGELDMLEATEAWISGQRHTFLTAVNLGSWSGISVREMADQAGCLDFYNYVYTPFSACSHSMWHHVARLNLDQCRNPLHPRHYVPAVPELDLDPHYLYLAAKYLQKTLATFDAATGVTTVLEPAFDVLCRGLASLGPTEPVADEV